jgi:D-serine dehydratase
MPEFKAKEAERQKKKMEELAPYIEKAFARKARMKELTDDEIPNVIALGRQITQQQAADPAAQAAARRFSEAGAVPLEDPAKKKTAAE